MKNIQLNGLWDMVCEDGKHFPAGVPGTVLQTLLEQGVIADPFDSMNEYPARERTRQTYSFSRLFFADAETAGASHTDLVFEGLDTLAVIRLNGRVQACAHLPQRLDWCRSNDPARGDRRRECRRRCRSRGHQRRRT